MSAQFQKHARGNSGGGTFQRRGHAVHQRAGAAEGGKRAGGGTVAPISSLCPSFLFSFPHQLLCCFGILLLSHLSLTSLRCSKEHFCSINTRKMVSITSRDTISQFHILGFIYLLILLNAHPHVSIIGSPVKVTCTEIFY